MEFLIASYFLLLLKLAHQNVKLGECDWTRMDDNGLTEAQREEWAVYRQALRDITKNYDSLDSVVWPDSP